MTKRLLYIPFKIIQSFSRVRKRIKNIVKNQSPVSLEEARKQVSKHAPINHPHSASWHKHRNKLESREFWSKERMKSEEELRKDFEEFILDKEKEDVKFRE